MPSCRGWRCPRSDPYKSSLQTSRTLETSTIGQFHGPIALSAFTFSKNSTKLKKRERAYLKLNLQHRRKVDEGDLHRDRVRVQLRRRMEITAEAVVEIVSFVGNADGKYGKDVFRVVSRVCSSAFGRGWRDQSLSEGPIEQTEK